MRKLTHHMWAKVLAMILCVISLLGSMACLAGGILSQELPKEKKLRETLYEAIAENYSAYLLDNMNEENPQESLTEVEEETSLRYAVICAPTDNLTELKLSGALSDSANYLYGNPGIADSYEYAFLGGLAGGYREYYYNTNSLLGMCWYEDRCCYWEDNYSQVEKIEQFVFSPETGLFYTKTASGFYPINNIQILGQTVYGEEEQKDYTLTMDDAGEWYYKSGESDIRLDTRNYENWSGIVLGGWYGPLVISGEYVAASVETEPGDAPADDGTSGSTESGDAFSNVEIEIFEENTETDSVDVNLEESEEAETENPALSKIRIIKDISSLKSAYEPVSGYYDYDGTYYYYHEDPTQQKEYYWVLSYVDSAVQADDLFAEAEILISAIDDFRTQGLGLEILFVILFVASFAFLMAGAGHRKTDDEIHLRKTDKVPLIVLLAGLAAIEIAGGVGIGLVLEFGTFELVTTMVLIGEIAVPMAFALLVVCMSIAVRIKAGCFWKNTVLYWICKGFKIFFGKIKNKCMMTYRAIREHTSLFWKTVIGLLVAYVLELGTLLIAGDNVWDMGLGTLVIWFGVWAAIRGGIIVWAMLQMARLQEGSRRIAAGDLTTPIDTHEMFWEFKKHAENINKVGDGIAAAVEEQMKSERFKTELITNVSHDIKTPLTSIINYVDLIKKENITDETMLSYIDVLDRQSARLKKLIEDLMEVSKASTGNLSVNLEKCDAAVFLDQVIGEFEERLMGQQLETVVDAPQQPVQILADGRHLWRVFDNLLGNICKYAQPGTRVYISLAQKDGMAEIVFKNISKYQLNISGEELMERFVRGDSSRNTEGSGLGLSIAQSLMNLMHGTMEICVDGDLFKVILRFPIV